jgi:tetratricopeptide (TPR) repeat protein
VLVIGGKPGGALPVSPYEHWYAAQPAYEAGDYARAVAIASEGLRDWPEHPSLHYQLACYEALAGHREPAIDHLRIAYANNPATREWAAGDNDLRTVRDDPALHE